MATTSNFTTIAIKHEAANLSDIRQIAIVNYFNSKATIKPDIQLHPERKGGAPQFQEMANFIFNRIHGEIVVSWGPSTQNSLEAAFQKIGMESPKARWIDCQEVCRRTWPKKVEKDDSLEKVCSLLRCTYIQGGMGQVAETIGAVFLQATKESGIAAEGWEIILRKNVVRRRGE